MNVHELVSHHYAHAPGFAARMSAAGIGPDDIRSPADLEALPVLRKEALIELQAENPPFGGLLSCEPGQLKRIFQSPGPIVEPESRVADYWRWQEPLRAAGFRAGDVALNAFGYHLSPAGAMFEDGLRAVGCVVIPGGVGNQEQQVGLLHRLGVIGYVGLPSYLRVLLEKADELGLTLRLEKALVGAEPLPPSLRAYFDGREITVRQGYGTAECGSMGYECDELDGWHIPDGVHIDICDINSGKPLTAGESGEVVVTVWSRDYALIRFGTGDLSAMNTELCRCGRTGHRIMGWQGRIGDAVKVRGMFVHPGQVARVLARFTAIRRHQSLITRADHRDQFTLRVVLADNADAAAVTTQIEAAARDILKLRVAVDVVSEAELPGNSPALRDDRTWD
ncbi:MAG: AMP-binding protein [Proteobacteria bacterium]|nr:AMP-binding protein [Pseudomonadota bacterium]